MRIVFDTNILISATLWNGSVAQKFLYKCIRKDIKIYSSLEIIEEYKGILARDFDYSENEISKVMEKIMQVLYLVSPSKKVEAVKEDPEDNKIIECAVESYSQYIISYDKHLLNLKDYQGIKIIRPEEGFGLI
jgi:putative PIN family toxin of toxin-antitoxin system